MELTIALSRNISIILCELGEASLPKTSMLPDDLDRPRKHRFAAELPRTARLVEM
jgi:hypothetical protein